MRETGQPPPAGGAVAPPTPDDVVRAAALADPVLRNLTITHHYARLSAAMAARMDGCSNWCTFATWASRQAGATIRGEDLFDALRRRLRAPYEPLHPLRSLWRGLLRRGLFQPDTRLGRIVRAVHTPFDAFERASDAVARGNLKVFAEIGQVCARYLAECPPDAAPDAPELQRFLGSLREGDPPNGQAYLRHAFRRYQQQRFETDPHRRAALVLLANLEIGLHEQTRLQPEIRESLDAPLATARDLRSRLIAAIPGPRLVQHLLRSTPAGAILAWMLAPLRRFAERLAREIITERWMVLSLPGAAIALGRPLDASFPAELRRAADEELRHLLARFGHDEHSVAAGAEDWSELPQRMHVIAHLFCASQQRADLFTSPFSAAQLAAIQAGHIPDGTL